MPPEFLPVAYVGCVRKKRGMEKGNGEAEMERRSGESGEIEGDEKAEFGKQGRKRNTEI